MVYMRTTSVNPQYSINPFYPQKPRFREPWHLPEVTANECGTGLGATCEIPQHFSQSPPLAPTFRIFTLLCLNNGSLSIKGKPVLLERDCEVKVPLSMGFSRQEYWSGVLVPSPGIFLTQGSNPGLLHCRQILYYLKATREVTRERDYRK